MPAKKSYQVYVAPNAKGRVKARAAARIINQQAGRKVVTIVNKKANADAVIRAGNPRGSTYDGYMAPRGGKRDRITIDRRLLGPQGATGAYRKTLAAHELGHGLGLQHRPGQERNLMNPIVDGGTKLNAQQKKRVARRYKKGKYVG